MNTSRIHIKDYAKQEGITVTGAYIRARKGKIKRVKEGRNTYILVEKSNQLEKKNQSEEFVKLFFNNLDASQKFIIKNLLDSKIQTDKKVGEIYKDFENRFTELKNLTDKQIQLSQRLNNKQEMM